MRSAAARLAAFAVALSAMLGGSVAHAQTIGWWRMEADLDPAAKVYTIPNEVAGSALTGNSGSVETSTTLINPLPQTGAINSRALNGDADINGTINYYAALDTASITVEFFARTQEGDARLLIRDAGTPGSTGLRIESPNDLQVRYTTTAGAVVLDTNYNYDSPWTHFAFTYNQATGLGEAYMNGSLVASHTGTAGAALTWPSMGDLLVGNGMDGGGVSSGSTAPIFDELRISNVALDRRLFLNSEPPVVVTTSSDPDRTFQGESTTLGFGQTRVGTSSALNITVGNEVDSQATLGVGVTTSSAGFSGGSAAAALAGNSSINAPITFAPTARGAFSGTATVSSEFNPVTVNLSGQGVGPVFGATLDPGGANTSLAGNGSETIDFGEVTLGSSADSQVIRIANNSTDFLASTLDDLTVQPLITGPDAALFEVLDASTMTPFTGDVLAAGEFVDLLVRFNATSAIEAEAVLQLLTDQNAAFANGGTPTGDAFSFNLAASVPVPEPQMLTLWAALSVGLGVLVWRRRRR